MRKNWLAILCLALFAGLVNFSTAQEAKKVICRGKVVGSGGEPIAGAKVGLYKVTIMLMDTSAYEVKLAQQTTTKDDGAFTLEADADSNDLTNQSVIFVEKEGLSMGWANWTLNKNLDVEIPLGQAKVLAGKVVDESDNGIADAEVSIQFMMVPDGRVPRYLVGQVSRQLLTSKTSTEGKFSFGRIPADATAEFLVKKPGRATVSTFDPSSISIRGGKLQFTAGQDNIKLVMPVEAKIEGMVVEKDSGKPLGGVKIMVLREQNQPSLGQEPVVSKEDGTFSIKALSAGKYILQLVPQREGLADWVVGPVEVIAEAGKTTSGVKVEVSKGGLLEALITEAVSEKPLEKATVSIRQQESNRWFNALSDKEGVARIRLAPGEYQVSGVFKEGFTRESRQEIVSIENGKTARIKWHLVSQPKITGVVRDQAGKPVEGVEVRTMPAGRQDATTDSEGKFEATWDPRSWGGEETTYYLVARDQRRNLAAAVEVGKETRTLDIKLTPGMIFEGSVVDPNGKGIAAAQVMVMLRASNWGASLGHGEVPTNEKGNFEVKAIPQGQKYYVTAKADGYGQTQVEADADNAVDGRLKIGKLVLSVANFSVSGVVVDANDKPVAGATIYCYGEGQQHRETQTDAEGKFTLEKVCKGRISLNANVQGKTLLSGYVQTEAGAADVKIIVTQSGSGSGEFVPKQLASLVGKGLPELKEFGIELSPADVNDKEILVCFWDMEQRPSRHCITKLTEQAGQLKEKGVIIVAIQGTKVDKTILNDWVKKYNIPFAVGMVAGDEEKTRFAWGVRSLPWLILTDSKHIVISDGFTPVELNEKIKAK